MIKTDVINRKKMINYEKDKPKNVDLTDYKNEETVNDDFIDELHEMIENNDEILTITDKIKNRGYVVHFKFGYVMKMGIEYSNLVRKLEEKNYEPDDVKRFDKFIDNWLRNLN